MSVFTHPAEAMLKSAMADHAAGRLQQAEITYRWVLNQHPGDPLATHLLGLIAGRTGRPTEAVDLLEAAVQTGKPPLAFFLAWIDAAVTAGMTDRALAAAKKTARAFPNDPTAADRLAKLSAGTLSEVPKPDTAADDLHAKAQEHEDRGEWTPAINLRQAALAIRHHDPIGHKRLATALSSAGRHDESASAFQTALDQCPGDAAAVAGIGVARIHQQRFTEALELIREALRLDPNLATGWTNLAAAALAVGDHATVLPAARKALELDPHDPVKHSAVIALTNYSDGDHPDAVLAETRRFADRFCPPDYPDPFPEIDRNPDRPLRVGFVSPDFRNHSVCFFFASVLGHRDRKQMSVILYGEVANPDDMTVRVRGIADEWRTTVGHHDSHVVGQIRSDRIDILIDLCGHLPGNRLTVFGRRPAPVQMTWLGYPNTTGVPSMDYRITDTRADPPGSADAFYTERLIRLPDAFFVYQPGADTPPVAPLPMLTNGHPTFGAMHLLQKVPEKACDHWAAAMNAVPAARLLWVGVPDPARPMMLDRMTARGITADRIEFQPLLSLADFLAIHSRVDIALDTFPWTGHTSTCHGIWMGVPTLTLAGPTAVSRAGASVMGCLGLADDWVANDVAQFAKRAAGRVADPAALSTLRAGLRDRLANSPLTDTDRFAGNLEQSLRAAWRHWCATAVV